jgi:tetratricopeptide (TPR) repeat protein
VFITGISITGYASPDGSVGINNKLARERADAVRKYLASKGGIPAYLYSLGSGGEDWEGALWMMGQAKPFALRNAATSVIRNYGPADREKQLRKLDNGKLWTWMMKEIFPPLRRVVCKIEYNVRGFNVDEAKRIIRTRPQQLNLGEMFVLANVYAEGSKDFEAVFETAVRLYPDDPIANLNAAASALLEKDVNKAERYLQRAQKNTPAYYNNMGALMMLRNQPAVAREYFQRAAQSNLGAALRNLQDMDK